MSRTRFIAGLILLTATAIATRAQAEDGFVSMFNGSLMCEVEDRDATHACRKGVVALQMHKGPPMKVQFKNLRIKVLDGQE